MVATSKKKARSKILDTVHEMAQGLYDAEIIDATTMREYDALCLPLIQEFTARDIKRIRLQEKVSQAVFAKILNTSPSTIRQWEQGDKNPRGTSLKLLNLVSDKGLDALL